MAITISKPTVDEVLAALAEKLSQQSLMIGVTVTDSEDPGWSSEDHINFTMNHNGKDWIMEGPAGMKIKLSAKLVEPKVKKEKPIETAPEIPPAVV